MQERVGSRGSFPPTESGSDPAHDVWGAQDDFSDSEEDSGLYEGAYGWDDRDEVDIKKETVEDALERIREFEGYVDLFVDVRKGMDAISSHAFPKDASAALDGILEKTLSRINATVAKRIKEISRIDDRYNAIRRQITDGGLDADELNALVDEQEVLNGELDMIETEVGSLHPILRLKAFIEAKKRQFAEARRLEALPYDELLKELSACLGKDRELSSNDVTMVEWHPFGVVIGVRDPSFLVTKGATERDLSNWGKHFCGTPINVVFDNEYRQATIRHELVHNVLDAAELERRGPLEMILEQAPDIDFLVTYYSAGRLLDLSHEEILAEAPNAERVGFGLSFGEEEIQESIEFAWVTNNTATAGRHATELVTWLVERVSDRKFVGYDGDEQDLTEEQVEWCRRTAEAYRSVYLGAIRSLDKALAYAGRISEDTHERVHMMAFMLKPSQYHALPALLRRHVGKEAYDKARPEESE